MAGEKKRVQNLSVCVQCREGSIQHAAPHLGMAVIQRIRNKEEEERGDL